MPWTCAHHIIYTHVHIHTHTHVHQKLPHRTDTFHFPVWEAKIFEVQMMGLSEALGYAMGSGCVDYLTASVVACVCLFMPLLFLTYVLHSGVIHHATYVPAEGNFFSLFMNTWREDEENKKKKWFLCIPYGFVMLLADAIMNGNGRGDWEPNEDDKGIDKDAPPPPYWENPWSLFLNRYGPMFADFTKYTW
jgi:hypothetical protein